MDDADVVIVGAGIAGSATARALAQSNRKVILLEQFRVGHARGSSHGTSRIFRYSYADPVWVRLAMEALPLWRRLEEESAEELIITTGGLDYGNGIEAHARALEVRGAAFEMLDRAEAARRFPVLGLPDERPILFQPDAGITLAERAVAAMVRVARRDGVEVREDCKVESLSVKNGHAVVATTDGTITAPVAVVTAGAWASRLLQDVGIDLSVVPTRETVAYFRISEDAVIPTLVEWEDPPLYALPAPGEGVKAGEHHAGPVTDPDVEGVVDEASLERIIHWIKRRYPGADPVPTRTETCIYTNTSDERFLIERHGPIIVGSACSGHGFKFGPLTGHRLAELAIHPPRTGP